MWHGSVDRRAFLAGAAGALVTRVPPVRSAAKLHVACASYSWEQFYLRDAQELRGLTRRRVCGGRQERPQRLEPAINAPADLDRLVPLLKKSGLELRSLYVNTELHRSDAADEGIRKVVEIARKAKAEAGTRLIVTNPSPIRWGGMEDKDDAQLGRQVM